MNLEFEKQRKLSTQDMYDILAFAVDAAEDNGFMNSFVFERAMYEYAAIMVFQEDKEILAPKVAQNVNSAWDYMLEEGYIDRLVEQYQPELDMLADCGERWMEEYTAYAHSARGLLDTVKMVSGDITQNMISQLKQTADQEGVSNLIQIADHWGMNNTLEDVNAEETETDSVFE